MYRYYKSKMGKNYKDHVFFKYNFFLIKNILTMTKISKYIHFSQNVTKKKKKKIVKLANGKKVNTLKI